MGNTQTTVRSGMSKSGSLPKLSTSTSHLPTDATLIRALQTPQLTDEQRKQMLAAVVMSRDGTCLQLAEQSLLRLPAWVCLASGEETVTEVDVSKNRLREFPEELARFRKVDRLGLGSNEIGLIPDCIGDFEHLTWLDFTHNRIAHVSDRLGDLPWLSSLGASDCRLTIFPLAFTRLRRLRKLGVFNNLITALPPEVGNMKALTKLDLSGNALTCLPAEIGHLTNLIWLNVSNNQLKELPEEIGDLKNMRELGLAHNLLTNLPDLSGMRQLTLLTAFNNNMHHVGDWIVRMVSLTKVDLSANKLTAIPEGILSLPSLELLNLRNNHILEIPPPDRHDALRRPKSLVTVDLRDNLLNALPISILNPCLRELKCAGNSFYTGALSRALAIPYLRSKAIQKVASERLPGQRRAIHRIVTPLLRVLLMEMWEGSVGSRCVRCEEVFIHPPVRFLDMRVTTDVPAVPFLVELCSGECRQAYMRHSMGAELSTPCGVNSPR